MEKPSTGRIVHFVMPDGACRPAVVVRVWEEGRCNLQVFTDGSNDGAGHESGIKWATSVSYSEEAKPSTWHWPERVLS